MHLAAALGDLDSGARSPHTVATNPLVMGAGGLTTGGQTVDGSHTSTVPAVPAARSHVAPVGARFSRGDHDERPVLRPIDSRTAGLIRVV